MNIRRSGPWPSERWVSYPARIALLASLAVAGGVQANPTVSLTKTLVASSNPIPSGQVFNYNMAWSCPGAVSPADDCMTMRIVESLPAGIQATALPSPDGKLSKVCVQNPGDPLPDYASCTQPSVSTGSPTQAGATLHFVFVNRVLAGDSGSLQIGTRFPVGVTPDGTGATNDATISAACDTVANPACSPAAPVTATSSTITATAGDAATLNKSVQSASAIGYDMVYRITACPGSGSGYLYPTGGVVTDTLPAEATFVSSSPAPASQAGQTLSWNLSSPLTSCQNIDVTVNYADASNNPGDSRTNNAIFDYTPYGTSTASQRTALVTHTLDGPNPGLNVSKTVNDSIVNPGQTLSYTLTAGNNGNIPLGLHLDDTLPGMCEATQFTMGPDATGCQVELSDNSNVSCLAAGPTVTAAEVGADNSTLFIKRITVDYGDAGNPLVPVGSQRSVTINCDVVNPGWDGTNYVMPATVANTAYFTGYNGAATVGPQSSTRDVTLRDPAANATVQPDASKTQSPGGVVAPGNTIRFEVGMTNSGSYSSAPEQVPLVGPVFADLLAPDMSYVSSALVGSAPAGCAVAPDIHAIPNYNGTGRTMVVWSWAGKACSLARGETVTYDLVAEVGPTTPGGSNNNHIAFLGSDNPDTVTRGTEGCATTGGFLSSLQTVAQSTYLADTTGNAANGIGDSARRCHAVSRSYTIQRITNISSRKAVRGTLDSAWLYNVDEPNNVARSVPEGAVFWRLEIQNTANVPLDHIELIDIVPFDAASSSTGESNTGVGTGVPLGSTWRPRFTSPIDLAAAGAPAGTVAYYTQAPNPCRDDILTVAGCNPMTVLPAGTPLTNEAVMPAPGAAGEWSTVLPTDPTRVRAFRVVYPTAHVIPAGETLAFEYPMYVPLDAPITDCPAAASSSCSNIAWNTFGFGYEEADIGLANRSAPTRVGVIVQPLASGTTASLGDFVWHDTDQNGQQGTEEAGNGINNVLVELFSNPDGVPNNGDEVLVSSTTTIDHPSTGLQGYYRFAGLTPSSGSQCYFVRFHRPTGFTASPANSGADLTDSDGVSTVVGSDTLYQTACITLSAGQHRPDIDQGFYQDPARFSLGNRVWLDRNADGIDNDGTGATPGSSDGISGVTVELWPVDGSGNPTGSTAQATQVTNTSGHYLFQNLTAGDYRVVIPASQWGAGQPLEGLYSSGQRVEAGGVWNESGFGASDTLDHGLRNAAGIGSVAAGGALSAVVTLGPLAGAPTDEIGEKGPNQTPGYTDPTPDTRSNLSVDFGFYALSVGNRLWFDDNNDGVRNASEFPVVGALVELLDGAGNVLGSCLSDADGRWVVPGLPAGAGLVARVSPTAFQPGGPLEGFESSTWYTDSVLLPGNNIDHGVDSDTPAVTGIASLPFSLGSATLPLSDGIAGGPCAAQSLGDAADNLVLDFGFIVPGTPQDPGSPILKPGPAPIPALALPALLGLGALLGLFGLGAARRRQI